MKLFIVAGARPNFMKVAPIIRALEKRASHKISWQIVHTGQHYDYELSQAFFDDLSLPKPDFFLESGSGSQAEQTAGIMTAFEKVCLAERPDIVIVVGDVNSTLACSIVAKKLGIRVAHVEAGLRSFDLSMPEEINRMVTDAISDLFFVTEESGVQHLLAEGKPMEKIHLVGNVMIDNLHHQMTRLTDSTTKDFSCYQLKKSHNPYVFLTLHRPSNVDDENQFRLLSKVLNVVAQDRPIFFPVHPRTRKMIKQFDIDLSDRIFQMPSLNYTESLFLWKDASLVLTDSGGLQEETTALGIPCFTIRNTTERPVTVSEGSNLLVGTSADGILTAFERFKAGQLKKGAIPQYWDGKAAERILDILLNDNWRVAGP